MKNNQIEIEDYSLAKGELFAQVSLPSLEGEANFFNISFDEWDVIEAAIALKMLYEPCDHDKGRDGQKLRIGYDHAAFRGQQDGYGWKKPIKYFSYPEIEREFSGEDREAIVFRIAMRDDQITNALTLRAI